MENFFLKKIDFDVTFSVVWYKINHFSCKTGKNQVNCLSGIKCGLNGRIKDNVDQMKEC